MPTLSPIAPDLLAWFSQNARTLPFRQDPTPYHIWVSEIMLQQTRVAAALEYYDRWMKALPTIRDLAECDEEKLHKLWEGLGYYSRARNLHKAARIIVDRGGFPDTYEGLLALPGIGDYTASAIASACFGRREAAVDGNVLRVVTRLTDCHDDILAPQTKRRIRAQLQAVMPERGPDIRLFNQATMELGATVCAPNGPPRCGECPAADLCLGRLRGTAEALPVKAPQKERRIEHRTVFLLLRGGSVALRRRPNTGLLAGLWEFPSAEGALDEAQAAEAVAAWGLQPKAWRRKLTAKHIFTHVEWHMDGYVLEVAGEGPGDFVWVNRAALEDHAVPSAFARYYAEAKEQMERE